MTQSFKNQLAKGVSDPRFADMQDRLVKHYDGIADILETCSVSFRQHQTQAELAANQGQLAAIDLAAHRSLFTVIQELLALGMGIANVQPKQDVVH